jgi:hypothetical protein
VESRFLGPVGARALAASCGVALLGYPMALAGPTSRVLLLAAVSAACLVAAIARPAGVLITLAAVSLAGEYALALVSEGVGVDLFAPVVAVLWFTLLEVLDMAAAWSGGAVPRPEVVLRRLAVTLGVAVAGGLAAAAGLGARFTVGALGVAATIAGAVCLLSAVAVTVALAVRTVTGPGRERDLIRRGRSSETA